MPGFRTCMQLLALVALTSTCGWAHASQASDAAQHFLERQAARPGDTVTVKVWPATAKLPACAQPAPFLPGQNQPLLGRVTVGVRCADGQVRYLQARITVLGSYWVADQAIPADTSIAKTMLRRQRGDLAQLPHGAIRSPEQAVGKVSTRYLAPNAVLVDSALKAPQLVRLRQIVTVEVVGKAFRVSRQGRALQAGGMHDTVRVRMQNRKILTGVVAGPGIVDANP